MGWAEACVQPMCFAGRPPQFRKLRALDYTAFSLYQRTSICRFKDVPVRFYRCVRSEDFIVRIETGDAESAVVWFERTGLAVICTSMYSIG